MRSIFISGALTVVAMLSCQHKPKTESPLAVVVKYVSAEIKGLKEDARQYIDVQSVYSKHIKDEDVDYEKVWEDQLEFRKNVGASKKIESCFSFYEYDIEEVSTDTQIAIVTFKSRTELGDETVYELQLINDKWVIVSIDYLKK